jgi:NADH:ubiquinone oxidoreductase subunit 6 (subunit J)
VMLASITDWVHLGAFVAVFVVTLISAVWVMLAKEVARAAVSLFVCLSGVAGIYFFLDAQFLGVVQIMVYVGGTTVLLLFGVMLTNRQPQLTSKRHIDRTLWGCLAMGLVLGPLLAVLLLRPAQNGVDAKQANGWVLMQGEHKPAHTDVVNLGDLLLTNYLLPFEIASIVLLIALVGAAYLARRRPEDAEPEKL